jgi:hypothetical protein
MLLLLTATTAGVFDRRVITVESNSLRLELPHLTHKPSHHLT